MAKYYGASGVAPPEPALRTALFKRLILSLSSLDGAGWPLYSECHRSAGSYPRGYGRLPRATIRTMQTAGGLKGMPKVDSPKLPESAKARRHFRQGAELPYWRPFRLGGRRSTSRSRSPTIRPLQSRNQSVGS